MKRVFEFRIWDKHSNKMINYHPYISVDDTLVLMQFTGLYDSVGNKIFEGDLVQFRNMRGLYHINYDNHMARFQAGKFPLNCHLTVSLDVKDLTVVGNIYEQ